MSKGLEESFGAGYRLQALSDRQIVEAIQDYKIAHNAQLFSRSPTLWPGLLDRARSERAELMELASPDRAHEVGTDPQPDVGKPPLAIDGVMDVGKQGSQVRTLQQQLIRLGYRDADGRMLVTDGNFGPRTEQGVEQFQRDSGLKVDGIVGPRTLGALERAEKAPLLSNPTHPDHALYRQALHALEQLPAGTIRSDAERSNTAATLAFEARVSGLSKIDHVVLSQRGDGLFAVQGALVDPAHLRIYADRAQAAGQPVERSTALLREDAVNHQAMHEQAQVATRQPTIEPDGPAASLRQ